MGHDLAKIVDDLLDEQTDTHEDIRLDCLFTLARLSHSVPRVSCLIIRNLAGKAGLEPTTYGFGDRCATNCATSLGELCRLHLPARILCKTTQEADGKTAKSK